MSATPLVVYSMFPQLRGCDRGLLCCACCCAPAVLPAGSELASCLSRSIQQSYHAVQEQFLAQARDLLLPEAQQHTESVVVGQPLPLDADFLKRAKDSKAQVCTPSPGPMLTAARSTSTHTLHAFSSLMCQMWPTVWLHGVEWVGLPVHELPCHAVSCCVVLCRRGSCWTLPQAGTRVALCWPLATSTSATLHCRW
jgi:hypothetical protein